ncbi:FtsW/RodA/SpoVE family cell cycle protein [Candidatus Marinarcus aquaticus]|uniref:Probable peptidoglycan glycosyltransferase FtsW n=1 Tax=Candidatus Marinarcus aquaticus TaxID=2044504 RepID=A0A4Q0XQ55_9BACT|nr:FtsW/RodA/SpoVE family cell cycle protein [Candidatus Marinarcus aquaticus]RXJ56169.1 cell division protein [Candidatus Marinarcus aquaticus]
MNSTKKSIKSKTTTLLQPDYYLFIAASILILISILFSYSLSVYTVIYFDYSNFHFFLRQAFVGLLSILIMWIMAQFDPTKWVKPISMAFFILFFLIMIIMPFLPSSLVTASGGANRWIRLPGFSLSPVEFFKIGFIYFLAWSFNRRVYDQPTKMKWKDEMLLVLPYFGAFLVVVFIVAFMQKDLGQVVLMGAILFILLMFANRSMKFFLSLGFAGIIAFVGLILAAPHRIVRIQSWWSMVQDSILSFLPTAIANELRIKEFPEPYQVSHSLNAIYNGGLSGTGLGEGSIKLGFLSEVHTDFVLAGITEELGFIGFALIVSLIGFVVFRILRISRRCTNQIDHLFTLGIGLMIIFSFLINSYGISGMIPIKGIAVPFLSYGGSALLSVSIAVGLVLSISRTVNLK